MRANPVAIDALPADLRHVRGGAIAARYPGNGTDLASGRHTVTIFTDTSARETAAVTQLRRRS